MIRRPILALFLALPLLGGCTGTTLGNAVGVLTGSVATQAPATTADAEKALTVAHLALNTLAVDLITAAKPGGVLHGTNATTARAWYDKADDTLKAADQLDTVANAQGIMDKVNEADTLIGQINTLIHG